MLGVLPAQTRRAGGEIRTPPCNVQGEDYWLVRIRRLRGQQHAEFADRRADGTVTVRATRHLSRRLLPEVVAAGYAVGSGRAEAWLTPVGGGSRLRITEPA
jgi:hypothetical protein